MAFVYSYSHNIVRNAWVGTFSGMGLKYLHGIQKDTVCPQAIHYIPSELLPQKSLFVGRLYGNNFLYQRPS